jgi:thymidylate synthase
MRSNDILRGIQFDAPFFTLLMQCMVKELEDVYPNLKVGRYTHHSASLHAYESDFELLDQMKSSSFTPAELPRIQENPILHDDIINMSYNDEDYTGDDKFIQWLNDNR